MFRYLHRERSPFGHTGAAIKFFCQISNTHADRNFDNKVNFKAKSVF